MVKKAEDKKDSPFVEIGVAGLQQGGGFIQEDFIPSLRGTTGIRIYKEMRDNDATIGALLAAVDMLLRAVEWNVEPAEEGNAQAEAAAEFMESIMQDMDHTWEDFISDILSMLVFGWSYFEIVYKRRLGLDVSDDQLSSHSSDGAIGVHKLALRAQDTLHKWEIDIDTQKLRGMWQIDSYGTGGVFFIPVQKALHFVTTKHKNNPEGRSILRNAHRSWEFLKNIEMIEGIAIERELAGLPVVKIPREYLSPNATTEQVAVRTQFEKIARDLKFNSQGALVIPSNTYVDGEGKSTGVPMVEIELLSAAGTRTIDTRATIRAKQEDMTRTVLADFLMLGAGKTGSFALSKDKSNLFVTAIETWLNMIKAELNRKLLPDLWKINGFAPETMPTLNFGDIAPVDLQEFGDYLSKIAGTGMIIAGDEQTEKVVRGAGGLPETIEANGDEFAPVGGTGPIIPIDGGEMDDEDA